MSWIKDFSKSAITMFKGQVIEAWQPLDFYHFFPLWYDLWLSRVAQVITTLNLEFKSYSEIKNILPLPSTMRAILIKIIPSYYANPADSKNDYRLVSNFFARMLQESCPEDPFAYSKNPFHSKTDINTIINSTSWDTVNPLVAKKIGQLITATGSLVHGFYNDLVTDLGWEAFGPYNLETGQELLIRFFPNLQPLEIWPEDFLASIKELTIYGIYQEVDWKINFVGCHTTSSGKTPVEGMKKISVYADGQVLNIEKLDNLINEFSEKAIKIYQKIRSMNLEEIKVLAMKQECYQLKKLFDQAGVEWQPTIEMQERVKNVPLLKNIFPQGKMIQTVEEFEEIFGIHKFRQEVLEEKV